MYETKIMFFKSLVVHLRGFKKFNCCIILMKHQKEKNLKQIQNVLFQSLGPKL